ncbi:hypothetical protein D3C87_1844590 [compost metagenome]
MLTKRNFSSGFACEFVIENRFAFFEGHAVVVFLSDLAIARKHLFRSLGLSKNGHSHHVDGRDQTNKRTRDFHIILPKGKSLLRDLKQVLGSYKTI